MGNLGKTPLYVFRTRATMKSISVSIKKVRLLPSPPPHCESPKSRSQCMTAQLPPTPLGKGHLVAGRAARLLSSNLLIASEGESRAPLLPLLLSQLEQADFPNRIISVPPQSLSH